MASDLAGCTTRLNDFAEGFVLLQHQLLSLNRSKSNCSFKDLAGPRERPTTQRSAASDA